ncbi:MAG: nitrous oxide reductase accessory protein NosL [Bryobacterales bacterium]|nr:nitrous oxide reductase accessory protein NosL [Bryobacterales bacterium]
MAGKISALLGFLCLLASCRSPQSRVAQLCDACRRPLHANSATLAEMGGRRQVFCCPACALSARTQGSDGFRIAALTDYATGKTLAPEAALLVRGSDVNLCARVRPLIDEVKEPHPVHYDRCTPSLIAFADKTAAARFMEAHGGRVMRFDELFTP